MNNVILIGRLTKEVQVSGNDKKVARYTLAVQREYKNKDGNYDSDFISCVTFGKSAEFAEKYLTKGMKIAVTGNLMTGSYEKDGVKHYTTDVVVNSHEFVEKKSEGSSNGGSKGNSYTPKDNGNDEMPAGFTSISEEGDDMPF